MPTLKKMEIAVINITTHPHSPRRYARLFQDAFNLKYPVSYRGVEKFILNKPIPLDKSDPTLGITGHFHKFVEIDLHGAWMNLERLETVESEDGEPVINIPEEMKPHCKTAPFVFLPDGHRFFFPVRDGQTTFSSSFLARSLMRLFSHSDIIERYGEVEVNVESEKESIQQILSIPSLTKLTVNVSLPNPDDLSSHTEQALARMNQQHAQKVRTTWTGNKDGSITPDDDTKGFMELALSNGYIKAEGYADTQKVVESTSNHPVIFKEAYPFEESPLTRVLRIAQSQIQRFTGRS